MDQRFEGRTNFEIARGRRLLAARRGQDCAPEGSKEHTQEFRPLHVPLLCMIALCGAALRWSGGGDPFPAALLVRKGTREGENL